MDHRPRRCPRRLVRCGRGPAGAAADPPDGPRGGRLRSDDGRRRCRRQRHHPLCPESPGRRPAGHGARGGAEPAGAEPDDRRRGPQGGCPAAAGVGGSPVDAGDLGARPPEVPARLVDDLELGGGLGVPSAARDRAGALAARDAQPAATADEALEVVRKYTCRWPIEEVHLVLKSGCKVEDHRLETWDGLEKAVTVNAAVAARIVSLRDLARETPEARLRRC